MGSALRLLVLFCAMLAIAATVVGSQLWIQQRQQARLKQLSTAEKEREVWHDVMAAYRDDQRLALILTVVASYAALVAVMVAAGIGHRREPAAPLAAMQRERGEVEHLARANAAQTAALVVERDVRQRAEENLLLQQLITNQALSEKIRISRDLHDGIIQSLYATGLILESALKKQVTAPAEARTLFEKSRQMLNTSIRDIRGYIGGLAPDPAVSGDDFRSALTAVIESLGAGADVRFAIKLDPPAATRVHPEQMADLLQVTREAVSNALRHGQAQEVSVWLREDGDQLCLRVEDNGRGFSTATVVSTGYGLKNLQARADLLHGELRIGSEPGAGARVVLTFPLLDSSPKPV